MLKHVATDCEPAVVILCCGFWLLERLLKDVCVCLSSDSGPWRLAPSGRDQDPESERPLRHNAEARVKKRQRAHQPRAEGNQTVCVCVCVCY